MINVAIIGVSGYTGAELTRLLSTHRHANITAATSRQYAGKKIDDIYPHLRGQTDVICEDVNISELCQKADLFFTAVPHKTAMEVVPQFLRAGKKVIDLSADFRLKDANIYEQWYQSHTAPDYIKEAVYGLPEIYRKELAKTSLIANPGCYPTSIILGLAPLLENKIIHPQTIIADSKSGTSGAGRGASVATLFCEVADGFRPYNVAQHRHTPEIEQELCLLSDEKIALTFTPHLLPISRGILSTMYADLRNDIAASVVADLYHQKYDNEPFVRLLDQDAIPATQFVRGSNYCDIGFKIDTRTNRIIVMSAIDNIVKGASGQAIQNMNILFGFDETEGLEGVALFP